VRVDRTLTELEKGGLTFGPPKTEAGRRTVSYPQLVAAEVHWHMTRFAQDGDDGLLFTGPSGAPMRRGNFRSRVWLPALKKAGLPTVHFHDLRHTGNTLTAHAGANLRELMARMGHSSTRAAMIYLHSTDERQRAIADALGDLAAGELARIPKRARPGTDGRTDATGTPPQERFVRTPSTDQKPGPELGEGESGAKGTRTPDPLLANNRHHVHPRPSSQVTVPERVSKSLQIRTCCGTSVLYSPSWSATTLTPSVLRCAPRGSPSPHVGQPS
jgi:Phage integrase family